jgi:phosphomannomutase / phosphoglucomutase
VARLFGTNGIREVVGERLTPTFVGRIVAAVASVTPVGAPIAVGWDGRTSSPAFARLASATLALAGHRVVELGLLPTPAIQYNIPKVGAQLGLIVTASHNPPEFNGLKCIAADGLEATREFEERIEAAVDQGAAPAVPFDRIGEIAVDSLGADRYVDGIVAQVDRARIASRKFSVVVDCGNGASSVTSPTLLRRLGCRVLSINAHVDGTFPGHLSEPVEANVRDTLKVVAATGADLGIIHDGDADRAIFVDRGGAYLPGEHVFTLLARDTVERHHGGVVVTPVSGSQAVEDAVAPLGGSVVYTRVGSPTVTREMRARGAVFGGEENGGSVFPTFQYARDGAMSAAAVLDLLARTGSTLGTLLKDVPKYSLVKEKIACPVERRDEVLALIATQFGRDGSRVLALDGVKAFRPGGWVLLRPSGTEPLFRVFAESKDPARARELADEGLAAVRAALAAAKRP